MLNGDWRFAFFENGDRAGNMERNGKPSRFRHWPLQAKKTRDYTNINYPFPVRSAPIAGYPQAFANSNSDRGLGGQGLICVRGGVSLEAELYINGKYVGRTQGSRLTAEFGITEFVSSGTKHPRACMFANGAAAVTLRIRTHSANCSIFRDVYVLSRPHGHIFDIDIKNRRKRYNLHSRRGIFSRQYDRDALIERRDSVRQQSGVHRKRAVSLDGGDSIPLHGKLYAAGEIITRKIRLPHN